MEFWGNLLILIGVIWIVSGFFIYMQTLKLNTIIKELRQKGNLYMGKDVPFMLTRLIVFIVIDKNEKIVAAKKLRTTIIVTPAKVIPFDEITGMTLSQLKSKAQAFDSKTQKCISNIFKNYSKK